MCTAFYVHSSVCKIVHGCLDLESEAVESVWLEIQTRKSSILVGDIHRNQAATFDWYDHFVTMMDRTVNGMLFYWVILILTCKKQNKTKQKQTKIIQHGIPQYPYLALISWLHHLQDSLPIDQL